MSKKKQKNGTNRRKSSQKRQRKMSLAERAAELESRIFEVNLPACMEHFATGNGETVNVLVRPEDRLAFKRNTGGISFVTLFNDSYFYPELRFGDLIGVVRSPGKKPVAAWFTELADLEIHEGLYDETNGFEWFPFQVFPQMRPFSEEEHRVFQAGGNTYEFYDAFYPGNWGSAEAIQQARDGYVSKLLSEVEPTSPAGL